MLSALLTDLPALLFQFLRGPEDLLHSSGNDPPGLIHVLPLHGERLATSRLAVGKAADIVAIEGRLHQQGDLLENLREEWGHHHRSQADALTAAAKFAYSTSHCGR